MTDRGPDPHPAAVEVVCEGDAREMGAAQGEKLREKVFGTYHVLENLEAFRHLQPWYLPYGIFRRIAERKALSFLREGLDEHLPRMRDRLDGIAQGSGINPGTLYLVNTIEAALSSVQDITTVPPPGACSAIAVRGARSADGEPVIARNFDYLPLVQPLYVLRDSRPADGFRSIDFLVAPMAGAVDGLNEKGLAITYDYGFTIDPAAPAPPISYQLTEAMRRCATVTEAADLLSSAPRCGGGMLMLADADGDIASLELSSTRSALRRPADGEDLIHHSNAFCCDETLPMQIPAGATFTDQAPEALRGCRVMESSELRDARFAERAAEVPVFGPDELTALMADHGPDGKPCGNTICVHTDYWYTTCTSLIFPRLRRLKVSYSTACEAQYSEVNL